jgi:hypothetical protein
VLAALTGKIKLNPKLIHLHVRFGQGGRAMDTAMLRVASSAYAQVTFVKNTYNGGQHTTFGKLSLRQIFSQPASYAW